MNPRLPILLVLLAIALPAAEASSPSSDAIFGKLYCRHLAYDCSTAIEKALGQKNNQYPGGEIHWSEIDRLSVDDKCLLALFWGLSLPWDGEKAETFGDFLGKDRVVVARRLQKIPEADLQHLCRYMGFPENRAPWLRRMIAQWLDPKMSGWFTSRTSRVFLSKGTSSSSSDEIFAKRYCKVLASRCSPVIEKALGKNLGEYPQKGRIAQNEIDRLSVDDKCLLALFWGLSLPLDGEKAELFGTFLGHGRVVVARRLQKIPEADLQALCSWMEYPPRRATYLRRQIASWLDPKMSKFFSDPYSL